MDHRGYGGWGRCGINASFLMGRPQEQRWLFVAVLAIVMIAIAEMTAGDDNGPPSALDLERAHRQQVIEAAREDAGLNRK